MDYAPAYGSRRPAEIQKALDYKGPYSGSHTFPIRPTGVEQPTDSGGNTGILVRDDAENDAFSGRPPSAALSLLLKLTAGLTPDERAILADLLTSATCCDHRSGATCQSRNSDPPHSPWDAVISEMTAACRPNPAGPPPSREESWPLPVGGRTYPVCPGVPFNP